MFGIVFIFIVMVFILYSCQKDRHMKKLARKIPGPKPYPIIGNALLLVGKPAAALRKIYHLSTVYTELMALWFGPRLIVTLFDPRDVEVIFRDKNAMAKADEYKFVKTWLGDSILVSSGEKFRINKKIMMPAFYANGLKCNIGLFNLHAQRLVEALRPEVGKEEFDIQNHLFHTMLTELLETTLGVSRDTLDDKSIIDYGKANSRLCKISHLRSYNFWLRFDFLFNRTSLRREQYEAISIVHPVCERIICRRKAELQAEQSQNKISNGNVEEKSGNIPLVDLLINATKPDGTKLSEEEIKDEMLTIMFAGQDTTTATIGFALSLLGLHQDIQEAVYTELYEIFGDSDRTATYEDLQRMDYLERVMQETWRLYPPVPLIARKPTADINLASTNCVLPKGCTVAIVTSLVHRNPKYFENPHRFDPDNFLPERIKTRHPYAFIPFSGGLRTCIGVKYATLNIKVILSTLLRNYKINATRQQKNFKLVAETTLKRKEGFLVSLELREKTALKNQNCKKSKSITQDESEDMRTDINLNYYSLHT